MIANNKFDLELETERSHGELSPIDRRVDLKAKQQEQSKMVDNADNDKVREQAGRD